jgi:hypothetical protein
VQFLGRYREAKTMRSSRVRRSIAGVQRTEVKMALPAAQ